MIAPKNPRRSRLGGGAGGIRTLSTDCPVSKMSGQIRDTILLVGALIAYLGADETASPVILGVSL